MRLILGSKFFSLQGLSYNTASTGGVRLKHENSKTGYVIVKTARPKSIHGYLLEANDYVICKCYNLT
jgi:hypothetical protein